MAVGLKNLVLGLTALHFEHAQSLVVWVAAGFSRGRGL